MTPRNVTLTISIHIISKFVNSDRPTQSSQFVKKEEKKDPEKQIYTCVCHTISDLCTSTIIYIDVCYVKN